MNKRKEIIPNNLKEHRIRCGYTQKEVAQKLRLKNSQDRISLWEIGHAKPNINNLFKLCKIYKIRPSQAYPEL